MTSSKEFYHEYCKAPLVISENSWHVGNLNLCFDWERNLMARFAQELHIAKGTILEIGFGKGIFASALNKLGNVKHIILEPHPEIYKKAVEWSRNNPKIQVFNCLWQDFHCHKNSIDSVMYDGYSEKNKRNDDLEALFQVASKYWLKPNGSLGFFYADPAIDKTTEVLTEKYFNSIHFHKCFEIEPNEVFLRRGIKDFMYVPIAKKETVN